MLGQTIANSLDLQSQNFKKMDKEYTVVYTTEAILAGQSPVLRVVHDEDGDWQFFANNESDTAGIAITSFKQALELDASLSEIQYLPMDSSAERAGVGAEWKIGKGE